MGFMDIQEQYELFCYMFSYKIDSLEDLEDFDEKLTMNFANPGTLLHSKDRFERAVLEHVHENAVCDTFDTDIIRRSFKYGYYPMSMRKRIVNLNELNLEKMTKKLYKKLTSKPQYRNLLTVRFHDDKMIITPESLHVTKKLNGWIKNKFSDYTMTFNKDFDQVIDKLLEAYPETWLCPELIEQLKIIHENPGDGVSVDSVEIWHDGKLVAGELGFITKNAYASLSGFHTEDDIGTVQMCILGKYLFENGFAYWDLGMILE